MRACVFSFVLISFLAPLLAASDEPLRVARAGLANRLLTLLVLSWILASQIWYYLQFSVPIRSILSSLRVHV